MWLAWFVVQVVCCWFIVVFVLFAVVVFMRVALDFRLIAVWLGVLALFVVFGEVLVVCC